MATQNGFELLREAEIPELNTRAKHYRHVKTGAELVSLENDDENKVFGITFRTPVRDSTGVPHILEHSVLGGSRKYRVKEPFVELVKGSLNTFLNAFTYPDFTSYPVASTNRQDFYNLVEVYLDAVFYPLLTPEHLQQEGWHYEPADSGGELIYKGIVFNEMKGAMSSPERVMYMRSVQSLLPETPYHFESGGDPKQIPDLTYKHFKDYYETHYHPSNALVWLYGDDDPAERLRRLDAYLGDYDRAAIDASIVLQPRFTAPERVVEDYGVGPDTAAGKKSMVTVNWLLEDEKRPERLLAWDVLSHILVGTPAAPLRKALLDSGLGDDAIVIGHNDSMRQTSFGVGLKGIGFDDADRVEALILQTLSDLSDKGIDRDLLEAALNTIEFRLRENNTGSFPRGLSLMLAALSGWLYGEDPLEFIAFEKPLAEVKAHAESGERYFEGMIRQGLLDNPHRTTVVLRPDPELTRRDEAAEKARLAAERVAMTPDELAAVADTARLLKERQEAPDSPAALATIPRLTLADLDRQEKPIPLEVIDREGHRVLYHDLFTNGIAYVDVGFDLHVLPPELLPYASLFSRALVEMGTEQEDYVKLSRRIGRETGGVRPEIFTSAVHGAGRATTWLFLRGKAMPSQTDQLLAILRDVLVTARLDNRERFRQMVLEQKARLEGALIPGGNGFVRSRLGAHFDEADWIGEQLGGISQLFFVRQLASDVDADWPGVLSKLEQMRQVLIARGNALGNVTLDASALQQLAPRLDAFFGELPAGSPQSRAWSADHLPTNEGLTLPGPVNYVGKGANLYALGYRYDASSDVVTRYLSRTWLWDQVRVQGGAYGGSSGFDHRSGLFAYVSYRDPNLTRTLDVYDQSPKFLRELNLDEGELTKAIIGTVSVLDAYRLPDAKGWASLSRYLAGETPADRQRIRDEVLGTTPADFRAFADVLDAVRDQGQVVVLGSQTAIEAVDKERPGWLTVTSVGI